MRGSPNPIIASDRELHPGVKPRQPKITVQQYARTRQQVLRPKHWYCVAPSSNRSYNISHSARDSQITAIKITNVCATSLKSAPRTRSDAVERSSKPNGTFAFERPQDFPQHRVHNVPSARSRNRRSVAVWGWR